MSETKTINDSPALKWQAPDYPAAWGGRVPKTVRMAKTVLPDLPIPTGSRLVAIVRQNYHVWVNSYGAISAITDNGFLGLRPYEFDIVEWHDEPQGRFQSSPVHIGRL